MVNSMVNVVTLLESLLQKKKKEKKGSLDLVSDFDNSKHLCVEIRNSCLVLLKGSWAVSAFS